MTHTELAELATTPEGRRQIDAMAGKAFGFTPTIVWGAGHEGEDSWYVMTARHGVFKYKGEVEKWIAEHPVIHGKPVVLQSVEDWPAFTTSIADAWQLVEKMRDRLPVVSWTGADWKCTFYGDEEAEFPTANAATAPLAITIAALLAVEKEKA